MMYKNSLVRVFSPQNRTLAPRGSIFFASIALSCILLLACDNIEEEKTDDKKVSVSLQTDKANFLVLTNTGFSTISGPISFTLNSSQENQQARSSVDLSRLPKPTVKSTEASEPSIIHYEPPPFQVPKQALSRFAVPFSAFEGNDPAPSSWAVGAKQNFNVLNQEDIYNDQSFILKKKVIDGDYTVYYWVTATAYQQANTSVEDDIVGDSDIQNIAKKFSNADSTKDILDTSIRIFGKPWGPHKYPNQLISEDTRDIHILLYDIASNGYKAGESRISGYFYPRDNLKVEGNAKLILNVDAPFFSRFPDRVYNTIIHEFQHLIQFYQKEVLRTNFRGIATWLNEMTAQMAIDLVSPVVGLGDQSLYKRIGDYIHEPWESLTQWDSEPEDYEPISDFGAFLLRKYPINGSSEELVRRIVHNSFTDYRAVTSVTGHSWPEMLREWAKATLNSYPASNDLAEIVPWQILEDEKMELGIPMFSLDTAIEYMLYYKQDGSLVGFRTDNSNTVKPPGPGSHVYVYLGRPTTSATVNMDLPEGLEYDIVAK